MKKTNKTIKSEYLDFTKATSDISKRTLHHKEQVLKSYIKFLGKKHIDNVKEKDLINYLKEYGEQTYNSRLSILRTFYKWHLKLDKREIPEVFKRMEYKSITKIRRRNQKKYMENLVTEEEYQTLLDFSSKIQHKAIIETLKLFGIRNSELRSMKIKGVEYNEEGNTKIIVYESKSMPRPVVYDGRAENLLTWVQNYHPEKNNQESYVFVNKENKKYHITSIDNILRRICKRANLRLIKPHDFRHTSITNDRKNGIPDTHILNNHGLVKDSTMFTVYDQNESKDYEEWLKQRKEEIKPTYKLLEEQKKTIEEKHEKELSEIKEELSEMKKWFKLLGYKPKDEFELQQEISPGVYVSKAKITEYTDEKGNRIKTSKK